MKKLLFAACALFGFIACTQNPFEEQLSISTDAPETIKVGFEDCETRIQLNEAQKTVWTKNDLVSVFYKSNANQKWEYQGETGERVAELHRVDAGTATHELSRIIVIYPYNDNYYINSTTCDIHAMLPTVQTHLTDSYGLDSNIMVSSSNFNQFTLKNVCGWIKIQLTGNGEQIKSIKLRGNNEEQVAGLIYINTSDASSILAKDNGDITENGDENGTGSAGGNLFFDDTIFTEVTLNCLTDTGGVELDESATSFYISLPPQSFDNGLTIEITDSTGNTMTKSTDKAITIERNLIQPMSVFEFISREVTDNENTCTVTGNHASFIMNDSGLLYSLAKKAIDNINTTEEWGNEIWSNITSITISGKMDARDFSTIKWNFRNLENLDISNVTVVDYYGNKGTVEGYSYYYYDDTIPLGAFFYWMSNALRPFPQELSDEGMPSLVSIKLPDGIKVIQRNAFARAYNLVNINIPNSVETIGWVSFAICTSLEQITIPENVLVIEDCAFKDCTSLNSVYCMSIYPPTCGSRVFDDNASNRKIYVPHQSVELYQNAEGWKYYADDIVGYDFDSNQSEPSIKTIVLDTTKQPIYAGGHITGYNNADIVKKGVIVSSNNDTLGIDDNVDYEISPIADLYIGHLYIDGSVKESKTNKNFKAPQDLSVYDCSNINKEQYLTPLICLNGNTKYYIRAYAITNNNEYVYGDIIEITTIAYDRCTDSMAYANVWYWRNNTLFDLVTDEIINIDNGFYYSTNENPAVVRFQTGYSYNTCYKFATEWNYKLWYHHNIHHCNHEKVVNIPIMSMDNGSLIISKSLLDIDKNVTIYYQVNGDENRPENFKNIYTEPIKVTSGDIVYCYAISDDGYISYTNIYKVQ